MGAGLTNKLIPIPLLPTGEAASGYLLVQWKEENVLYLRFEMQYRPDFRSTKKETFRTNELYRFTGEPVYEAFDDFVSTIIRGVWEICINNESIYYRTMKDMYAGKRL